MQWWGRCVSQQGALNISSAIDLAARRHVPESPRITPPQHTRQRRSEMRMSAVWGFDAHDGLMLERSSDLTREQRCIRPFHAEGSKGRSPHDHYQEICVESPFLKSTQHHSPRLLHFSPKTERLQYSHLKRA